MTKKRIIAVFALLTALLLACAGPAGAASAEDSAGLSGHHRVIIDTDTAGDDAFAIAMAVYAPNVTVEGLTVLSGNVPLDQAVANALMCVEAAGAPDIPVYRGAETTYNGVEHPCFSVFGTDGMGDADLIHPTIRAQEGSAVDFIIDTVRNNPGEIELMCLGPVTNIALAFEKDPEAMSHVKQIYVMGTSGFGPGNATPVAEFNVYHDAEGFQRLLDSGAHMIIIPLDMCTQPGVLFYRQDLDRWLAGTPVQQFLGKASTKLFEFYTVTSGLDYMAICDAVAVYAMLFDAAETAVPCAGKCITDPDSPAYGLVVLYRKDTSYDSMPQIADYNLEIVTKMAVGTYHEDLLSLIR